MALKFTAASTTRLIQDGSAGVSSALPNMLYNLSSGNAANTFTVGFWYYVPALGSQEFYNMCRQSDVNIGWILRATAGNVWDIYSGGVNANGGTVSVGWHYVLIYVTTGADARFSILQANGAQVDVALTSGSNFTWFGEPSQSLGARFNGNNPSDGLMAEFWSAYGNVVVPGGGAAVAPSLLRRLAYRGPWSVPRLRKDIIEYRSFRTHPTAGHRPDIYFGAGKSIQTWTNNNGVTIGPHPPHAQPWNRSYIRPGQSVANRVAYAPDEVVASSGARAQRGGFIANVGGLMGRF